jgi:hypothetical protein
VEQTAEQAKLTKGILKQTFQEVKRNDNGMKTLWNIETKSMEDGANNREIGTK